MSDTDTLITLDLTPDELAHLRAGLVCWETAHAGRTTPEQARVHRSVWRLLDQAAQRTKEQ